MAALRIYRLLARCLLPLVLGWLWWRGRQDAGYRQGWSERLGAPAPDAPTPRPHGVLLHCASVGEVIAARPLVERLLADPRTGPLLLTCATPTGARQIRQDFGNRVAQAWFPLDLPGAVRRFLARWQPRLVLLMERELWPEFLVQAQAAGVPVVLVNARLSERSANGYRRWQRLMVPALARLRLVCAEDTATAGRFAALGVPAQRLLVTGNLKSDVQVSQALRAAVARSRATIGTRPVLVAGSTHPGEDEALLAALPAALERRPDLLLVLVPRHPERFDAVAALLAASGLRHARHGRGDTVRPDTQVLLGDTMGELMHWYGVADICFIGGSLVPRGGHNPLEALVLDRPVLSGPHTRNFDALYAALEHAGALGRVADASAVFAQLELLLRDPALRRQRIDHARTVCASRVGALARTLQALGPWLDSGAPGPAPLVQRDGHDTVWLDPALAAGGWTAATVFDAAAWQARGSVGTLGAGRGTVRRVADGSGHYLMRHYYRGGLMARLSRDRFLAQPLAATRAMAEYTLLLQLRARGLPVPRPVAARCERGAASYRADILVAEIAGARDVARRLHGGQALSALQWQRLGAAIRALHDAQVHHSDLNCHNLLLDAEDRAWVVDFDKCAFRAGEDWKADNLARLRRSLRKELRLDPALPWDESQWEPLYAGYVEPDGVVASDATPVTAVPEGTRPP